MPKLMEDSHSADIAEKGTSLWKDAWLRLRKNRMAVASLLFLIFALVICFLLPTVGQLTLPENGEQSHWYKPPNNQNLSNTFQTPDGSHWLGTDQSGRDLFSRVLHGGQVSILIGILATLISVTIGVIYGAIAGYKGGKIDTFMMRFVDICFGLPQLVIIILFSIVIMERTKSYEKQLIDELAWSESLVNVLFDILPLCIAIGCLGWFTMARVVRSQVMSTKELEYVEAAKSLGLSHFTILFKHILPNLLGIIIVYTSLTIPTFILTEATLSFLGLGVEAPNSSWGILLSEGATYLETEPQIIIIPSVIFSLTLLALNFFGDGLRDALDPKASKD